MLFCVLLLLAGATIAYASTDCEITQAAATRQAHSASCDAVMGAHRPCAPTLQKRSEHCEPSFAQFDDVRHPQPAQFELTLPQPRAALLLSSTLQSLRTDTVPLYLRLKRLLIAQRA